MKGVYKITNTITGDFYIGSSKNVEQIWAEHKCQSTWNKYPNNPLYQDMQKYGIHKFSFQILEEVEETNDERKRQQYYVDLLRPAYNKNRVYGRDIEYKTQLKNWRNQLCYYNGDTITLSALSQRFRKAGIPNPTKEAKKYLVAF